MKKTKAKKQPNKTVFLFRVFSFSVLGLVLLVTVVFSSYQLAYHERIYPGIKISNIDVGNKSPRQAKKLLEEKVSLLQKNGLSFSFNGEVKTYSLSELGIVYDLDQAVRQAYFLGRQPNLVTSLKQKIKAWNNFYNLSPQFSFNNQKFLTSLDYFNKHETKPQEAKISFPKGQLLITPPKEGKGLDFEGAKESLVTSLQTLSISPIPLDQKILLPQISSGEVEAYRDKITTLIASPIKLKFERQEWVLTEKELVQLISFSNTASNQIQVVLAGQPLGISSFNTSAASNHLSLSQVGLKDLVTSIAKEIDQEAVNAKFNFEGGRVTQFSSHQDGQKLDQEEMASQIDQIFTGSRQSREVNLKVAVTKAAVTTEAVNNLGISELIGIGTSKFAGSIPNRQANIGLASSRVNGTLVAPGEVFSMYKTIGEVEGTTGYKEAYIISKGRTQLDFGGGVCQVSTTLFRAALNSGLPIIERHPHAYRVGYYEQNSSPGIDASVFFPYSDFRFKNDTSHHVLIQTKFNPVAATLTFEFYGTKDGRQVALTKPVLGNQTPPPPELHQEDPTLTAGTVKQVDFAAWGATTSFSRTVTRGGEVLYKDTFFTKYAPWQAVFLHGTKVG